MKPAKRNQNKPVRLTLLEAGRIVGRFDDLVSEYRAGQWTDDDKAIFEPLIWQVQLVHAQIEGEFHAGVVDK
jgi:hypothetical protein